MLVGYARVSTREQNLDMQLDALKQAGCEKIFTDKASGANSERPGFQEALAFLRPGDTLVIWQLDRIGRDLKDLITIVDTLNNKDIAIKTLHGRIVDTTTREGKRYFQFNAMLAEWERSHMLDRTYAGLAAARARGRIGGRPPVNAKIIQMAVQLYQDKSNRISHICKTLKIGRSTLYKYLDREKQNLPTKTEAI